MRSTRTRPITTLATAAAAVATVALLSDGAQLDALQKMAGHASKKVVLH